MHLENTTQKIELWDTIHGTSMGMRDPSMYIRIECPDCGKQRWQREWDVNKNHIRRCFSCARSGAHSAVWKGGIRKDEKGYVDVWVDPKDFFAPMSNGNRRVKEHRLVMAKSLGRCLQRWEYVHHKNGIRDDNRIDNLELTTNGSHQIEHHQGYKDGFDRGYHDGKDKRVKELLTEIESLKGTPAKKIGERPVL